VQPLAIQDAQGGTKIGLQPRALSDALKSIEAPTDGSRPHAIRSAIERGTDALTWLRLVGGVDVGLHSWRMLGNTAKEISASDSAASMIPYVGARWSAAKR